MLNKKHRIGSRPTPAGTLFVAAEVYPTGCKFEFYQELVVVNTNGGRYDFDKRQKMPYLIGKAFEVAIRRATAHLVERGFTSSQKVETPNPDPLAYFNDRWNFPSDVARGVHRFKRDESGWPAPEVIALECWGVTASRPLIPHGAVRYFRDRFGRLARGRCYGGINGMWMVIYGPGPWDCTHLHRTELLDEMPTRRKRRAIPLRTAISRLTSLRDRAIKSEDFEAAIRYRNALRRIQPSEQVAA